MSTILRGLFLLAAASLAVVAATPSPVAAPSPSATPSQPPASVVARACIEPGVDYRVDEWNLTAPYLLCLVSDAHTGNAELLKRAANGRFIHVSHGGGDLPVIGLEAYGVPARVATRLRAGLHT